jgi:hypothetical protein
MFEKFERLYNFLKTIKLFSSFLDNGKAEISFLDNNKFVCQYPSNIPDYLKDIKTEEYLGKLLINQLIENKEPIIIFPLKKTIKNCNNLGINNIDFENIELYTLKIDIKNG